jgi:cell division protein FtsW
MSILSRTSRNPIAQWWWTVDRQMVIGVLILLGLGFFAALAASPAVAQHIGKSTYYFANKQLVFWRSPPLSFSWSPCSTPYGYAASPC